MNGNSNKTSIETLGTNEQPRRTILRLIPRERRKSKEEIARELQQSGASDSGARHRDNDDDDPDPIAA